MKRLQLKFPFLPKCVSCARAALWCVFLSPLFSSCLVFPFRVGKGCEVMSLGRAWGAPSWSEGLGVSSSSACEEVAVGVGP